jgi:hypothetical protein
VWDADASRRMEMPPICADPFPVDPFDVLFEICSFHCATRVPYAVPSRYSGSQYSRSLSLMALMPLAMVERLVELTLRLGAADRGLWIVEGRSVVEG